MCYKYLRNQMKPCQFSILKRHICTSCHENTFFFQLLFLNSYYIIIWNIILNIKKKHLKDFIKVKFFLEFEFFKNNLICETYVSFNND